MHQFIPSQNFPLLPWLLVALGRGAAPCAQLRNAGTAPCGAYRHAAAGTVARGALTGKVGTEGPRAKSTVNIATRWV